MLRICLGVQNAVSSIVCRDGGLAYVVWDMGFVFSILGFRYLPWGCLGKWGMIYMVRSWFLYNLMTL